VLRIASATITSISEMPRSPLSGLRDIAYPDLACEREQDLSSHAGNPQRVRRGLTDDRVWEQLDRGRHRRELTECKISVGSEAPQPVDAPNTFFNDEVDDLFNPENADLDRIYDIRSVQDPLALGDTELDKVLVIDEL